MTEASKHPLLLLEVIGRRLQSICFYHYFLNSIDTFFQQSVILIVITQTLKFLLILLSVVSFVSCGPSLIEQKLSIAVIDEPYYEIISADENSWGSWNTEIVFDWIGGDLPDGMAISSDGEITGTPTEFGLFDFEVRVYSIDEGWSWDYSDDYIDYDDAWFTLFVTEPNTNADCPWPDNESVTETYICVGTPASTTLALDEGLPLDINYQVGFDYAEGYQINVLDFTIAYDATLFAFDENELNSQSLYEVATEANADVTFDTSTAGELRVIVSAPEAYNSINYSGSLMYLYLYALQDIEAGTYEIPVTINSISSSDSSVALPNTVAISGSITVDESISY